MRINSKIAKFQEGGVAPAPQEPGMAPEQAQAQAQGGGDPIMQLAQMAQQALQSGDGQLALQVCEAFLQLIQQMAGQQEAAPQGEPVFRKGGVIVKRV